MTDNREPETGTPTWVIVLGVAVIALVLLVGVMLITGIGGEHGPGRHASVTHLEPVLVQSL